MKPPPNVRPVNSTTGLPPRNDFQSTHRFWKLYQELPQPVRRLAVKNYQFWRDNPRHPSLDFKKLAGQGERFSVRVGAHYRALGHKISGDYEWVWIGTPEDYNKLVR